MDLRSFADSINEPSLIIDSGTAPRLWEAAYDEIGNEWRTDSTVASVLSQMVQLTDEFEDRLLRSGIDPRDKRSHEVMLIGRSNGQEYILLVVADSIPSD